ncbi:MAG: heavy-metal-associated domain-containing protein [Eggerthellaceae bacterium]|nr:heavy-metal-associated domain-containing protein [Eggerthellaceae bacterium]MBQ9044290.1 heavy-metal-associated domain-containing protein [Eggerthellaceae bacterium]
MRKAFKLDGEICANCAGKIQAGIEKLPGVNKVSVNAMTLKFTLDADDDAFDEALEKSLKLFADIEPDCEVLV